MQTAAPRAVPISWIAHLQARTVVAPRLAFPQALFCLPLNLPCSCQVWVHPLCSSPCPSLALPLQQPVSFTVGQSFLLLAA